MGRIDLTWHEAQAGDLPPVCVQCGAAAEWFVDWRVSVRRHQIFSIRTIWTDVKLPVCQHHTQQSYFGGVTAKRIDEDAITLAGVCQPFIDALWNFRQGSDEHGQRPVREELHHPQPRPRDYPRPPRSSSWPMVVLIIALALILGPLILMGGMMVLATIMLHS